MSEEWEEEQEVLNNSKSNYDIPDGHRIFVDPTYDDPEDERIHLEKQNRQLHESNKEFYKEALDAFEVRYFLRRM